MLRRSGRWAKKVNDVINAESPEPTKGVTFSELSKKEMLKCPCCDFLAAFKSVLSDHYIAHHKVPNKNACLVCHLKFEATQNFLDHFVDHASGKLSNESLVEVVDDGSDGAGKKVVAGSEDAPAGPMFPFDKESIQAVVKNISEAKITDGTYDRTKFVKIPYQAAIQDRNMKDNKLKSFEDLKGPNDLAEMSKYENIKHFFKCIIYGCTFSTHNHFDYTIHLNVMHSGKRLHCCYCIKEFFSGRTLTEHMISEHSKRHYQCSKCFYRAYSKIHVQIHIKHFHAIDVSIAIIVCDPIEVAPDVTVKDRSDEVQNTTWPYVCAIGECTFQTYDPKEFKSHNEKAHRSVSVFFCHYCKVDFLSLKRLLNHYRLHGISTFQCNYCIHGSEARDDILLHLCSAHPDLPLQAFMRGSEEDASSEAKSLPVSSPPPQGDSPRPESPAPSVEVGVRSEVDLESLLFEVVGETHYPRALRRVCSDFACGVPACGERFEHMSVYVGHLRNGHAVANFPCPHCPEMAETWERFRNHLVCHGPELYSCGLVTCDFYDWNKHVVTDHLKSHANSAAKVVILRERDPSSGDDESDVDLLKTLPRDCPFNVGGDFYQCFFCRYRSSDKPTMKKHLYDEFAYRKASCLACNERFASREALREHSLKLHPDQEVRCSVESNTHVENLVDYLLNNNSAASTLNKCGLCSKNFKFSAHFHSHVRLCVQNRYQPYHCDFCMQGFPDMRILKFHVDEKHFPKPVVLYEISSYLIEQEIRSKLQQVRVGYLKEALGPDAPKENPDLVCMAKTYLCGLCSFESDHKHNVEVHCGERHGGEVSVKKELRNRGVAATGEGAQQPETAATVKRYRCCFCIKRLYTLLELESHMENVHPLHTEVEYPYIYTPDTAREFPVNERYDCVYCKAVRDAPLGALQPHCEQAHPGNVFKVRGRVVRNGGGGEGAVLACGHCYQLVDTLLELKQHTACHHESAQQRSIGGFRPRRFKVEEEDLPNQRVRLSGEVFECGTCGAAFSGQDPLQAHFRRAHPRGRVDFAALSGDSLPRFFRCEFCPFTAERAHLEAHLDAKHRSRVRCGHCHKRFEFATRLRQHHDLAHRDLPLRYSQETTPRHPSRPLDLNRVFVQRPNPDGTSTRLSVVEFSKERDIFPKVELTKCFQDAL